MTRTIACALTCLLVATPALAQQGFTCGDRKKIVQGLEDQYDESQRSISISGTRVVETFASEDGSWTVLVTDPNGLACMVLMGTHWEAVEPKVGEGS